MTPAPAEAERNTRSAAERTHKAQEEKIMKITLKDGSVKEYAESKSVYLSLIHISIPSLGSLTDVEQAMDTIQIVRGNPLLKTYQQFTNRCV